MGFERYRQNNGFGLPPDLHAPDLPRIQGLEVINHQRDRAVGLNVAVLLCSVHHDPADVDPTVVRVNEEGHGVVVERAVGGDGR